MTPSSSSCQDVLRANDRGTYTVPSPRLYPHQWAWDSAFAAIGWSYFDLDRAWVELTTLMAGQWEDGRVPHIYFHDTSSKYFPGPDFWGTTRSSSITQPPIWATAARRIIERHGDHPALAPLLPKCEASHAFFPVHRDPLGYGAVAVVHPWESGTDNSPPWDLPMEDVDISNAPPFERSDTTIVEDASQRPVPEHYVRYAALVQSIADDGFGPGQFAVYDPLVTSVLIRAEDDLSWLCERAGVATEAPARAEKLRAGLERLWDDDRGRYLYVDARATGGARRLECDVIGCYLPLWCGVPEDHSARLQTGLSERFSASWPLPSTSPTDPAFEARRYWRGPTWINVNWMLAGSVDGLAARTLELIARSGFREYYEPTTGEGLGAEQFTWTAALALDLLARS